MKNVETYKQLAKEKALKYGLDPDFFVAQIDSESGFNPKAKSPVGAYGLGQLLPSSAKAFGIKDLNDLYDPNINLDVSARYMSQLMKQHKDPILAMAAYNGGNSGIDFAKKKLGKPSITGEEWLNFMKDRRNKLGFKHGTWHGETLDYVSKIWDKAKAEKSKLQEQLALNKQEQARPLNQIKQGAIDLASKTGFPVQNSEQKREQLMNTLSQNTSDLKMQPNTSAFTYIPHNDRNAELRKQIAEARKQLPIYQTNAPVGEQQQIAQAQPTQQLPQQPQQRQPFPQQQKQVAQTGGPYDIMQASPLNASPELDEAMQGMQQSNEAKQELALKRQELQDKVSQQQQQRQQLAQQRQKDSLQNLINSMVTISQNNSQKFAPRQVQLQQPEFQQAPQIQSNQVSYMPYDKMNRYNSTV